MARVDYEAAWEDLQARILEREGWGSRALLAEMADLRVRHRITEGEQQRALRLAAQAASTAPGQGPAGGAPTGGPLASSEEEHDGSVSRSLAHHPV